MKGAPAAPTGAAPELSESELTVHSVRALFRAVLRGSDKVPGLEACREVAAWLQFLRLRRTRPAMTRPTGRAEKIALALIAELETLERDYARFPAEIARVPALPFLETALREQAMRGAKLRAARQALEHVLPILAPPAPDGMRWHDEAAGLYRVFVAAMKEANPQRCYAPSNEGAAVRFIRAAFALVLGEDRREAAIAQALKRLRRRGTTRRTIASWDRR
ncbi:MAG TPA: hypothetical protein VG848_13335 [Acetobacteraceae bacterium]|nr:hypothetical protein [Acetobacteraceae bacterium]